MIAKLYNNKLYYKNIQLIIFQKNIEKYFRQKLLIFQNFKNFCKYLKILYKNFEI